MGSAIALILIVCAVYLIVIIGTVAFQLTGLEWETAQFQALSAFTNTGFTTRQAELVVRHPVRRKITMFLVATGYAASASVIATLVTSVAYHTLLETMMNVGLLVIAAAGLIYVVRRRGALLGLAGPIRRYLSSRLALEALPYEELLEYKKGFAITRIEVPPDSRLVGTLLRDADLKRYRQQVLAIEHDGEVSPIPAADSEICAGDYLVIYGDPSRLSEAIDAPLDTAGELGSQAVGAAAPLIDH